MRRLGGVKNVKRILRRATLGFALGAAFRSPRHIRELPTRHGFAFEQARGSDLNRLSSRQAQALLGRYFQGDTGCGAGNVLAANRSAV